MKKRPAIEVLERIHAGQWLCTPECLATIISIASRENLHPAAVAAQLGRPLDNTRTVTVREGVATIPVVGPMFRYANFFTEVSGAVTYEELATDFQKAMDDAAVRAIIVQFDTPGGQATGVSDLAQLFRAAADADVKPVVAHVEEAASAGYWLAAAMGEVVTTDAGVLGSIGVRATVRDTRAIDEARGIRTYEIISSQSPNKRMDPATDAGRAQLQAIVDDLAAVFVAAVATYRGVSTDTVLRDFGQGGLLVGQRAVDVGLADRISTYEGLVAELQDTTRPRPRYASQRAARTTHSTTRQETLMHVPSTTATPTPAPEASASAATGTAVAPAAPAPSAATALGSSTAPAPLDADAIRAQERERIASIRALGRPGEDAIVQSCIDDPACTPAIAAMRLRAAENARLGDRLGKLRADATAPAPAGVPAPSSEALSPRLAARRATSQYYELTGRRRRTTAESVS